MRQISETKEEKERERRGCVCGRGGKEWDGDNRDTGMMIDGVCRKAEIHLGAIFP